jgi:hypothetical protein
MGDIVIERSWVSDIDFLSVVAGMPWVAAGQLIGCIPTIR